MSDSRNGNKRVLTEAVMLARLEKSDEMRAFFIEMWKQNPALAKQGGVRVQNLLSVVARQRGISLIELIIFIVIISVALVGILSVMNITTGHSADPLVHKQALVVAESLLEEIELQDYIDRNDGVTKICPAASAVTATNRANAYHIVSCYNGFAMNAGITDVNGAAVAGLGGYKASVAISNMALGNIAANSAVRITVTVTDPQANSISIDGYRTAY